MKLQQMWDFILANKHLEGDFLECGVWKGGLTDVYSMHYHVVSFCMSQQIEIMYNI